jgi:hypothetical protein
LFSCTSYEVAQQRYNSRTETAFGEQVHLELFNDDDLVGDDSLTQSLSVMHLGFRLDELHAQPNRASTCKVADIFLNL